MNTGYDQLDNGALLMQLSFLTGKPPEELIGDLLRESLLLLQECRFAPDGIICRSEPDAHITIGSELIGTVRVPVQLAAEFANGVSRLMDRKTRDFVLVQPDADNFGVTLEVVRDGTDYQWSIQSAIDSERRSDRQLLTSDDLRETSMALVGLVAPPLADLVCPSLRTGRSP